MGVHEHYNKFPTYSDVNDQSLKLPFVIFLHHVVKVLHISSVTSEFV